jgi:hypothetical protein
VSCFGSRQTSIALVCLSIAFSTADARCADQIRRLPDGRYLALVKDVTVALPEEDPQNTRIQFQVATPPGTDPLFFTLIDLLRDPDNYAPKLRSSNWSVVSAGTSISNPDDIVGIQVVRGVIRVAVTSGVDENCKAWNQDWVRFRDEAIAARSDQYGWIRQDHPKSPPWTSFIKFLDEHDRENSKYYALHCDFSGLCSLSACHNDLTARIIIHSSNKVRNEDFVVKEFDQQIVSGIKVLEHMLVNKRIDLSHP